MPTLVTGGAGFLGSHLCERLVKQGEEVICLDNFFTGRRKNISHLLDYKNFELMRHDVVDPFKVEGGPDLQPRLSGISDPLSIQSDQDRKNLGDGSNQLPGLG
jgi:nucleoside-diphosphate-sugar epimerase